jgi:hypothetical protein
MVITDGTMVIMDMATTDITTTVTSGVKGVSSVRPKLKLNPKLKLMPNITTGTKDTTDTTP